MIVFLLGVSNVGFLYITRKATDDCWASLRQTAQNADSRLVFISRSYLGALMNISTLFVTEEHFKSPEMVAHVQNMHIGPLQSPIRVYRPDGFFISEKEVGNNKGVAELYKKFISPSPIFTTPHRDLLSPGHFVSEIFFPIRIKGQIVGVVSAVLDLNALPVFFLQSKIGTPGMEFLVLDRRDSTLFMDTYHNRFGKLSEYSSLKPERGYSYDNWVTGLLNKQPVDYLFTDKDSGKVLFMSSVPSAVDNWSLLVLLDRDIALAKANLIKKVFVLLSLFEFLAFVLYLLWMIRDIRKRLESENKEYSDIAMSLSESFDSLFYVNLTTDEYIVFRANDKKEKKRHAGTDFFVWAASWIKSRCYFEDLQLVFDFLTKSRFTEGMESGNSLFVEFRLDNHGKYEYYRLKALKTTADKNHVVFAMENVDDEIHQSYQQRVDLERRNSMIASLAADYDCVAYVEVSDTGSLDIAETYRESELLQKLIPHWSDEKDFVSKIKLMLINIVNEADMAEFAMQTQKDCVLRNLKMQSSYFVNFRADIYGKPLYYQLKFIVGNENSEMIKGFVVGLHCVDEEFKKQMEIQEKLKRNLEIIDILSENYTALFYINTATSYVGLISLSDSVKHETGAITAPSCKLEDSIKIYIDRFVHPEDKDKLARVANVDYLREALKTEKRVTVDFRRCYSGVFKYTRMIAAKAEAVGEYPQLIAVGFSEIDAQYRAETERQENISRIMSLSDEFETIIDIDVDSGLYKISSKHLGKSGKASHKSEPEKDFFLYLQLKLLSDVCTEDRDMVRKCFEKNSLLVRLEKETSFFLDYRCNFDGNIQWFRMRVTRYGDWKNERRMLVGVFNNDENYRRDKAQQEALEQALQMANSASRAKTTFLNNMSHDIRTPMNAIIGYTGLAKSHLDNRDQVKDYLGKIAQSSDHLLSLINDVLDMSRIESGKMNLNEKEENISNIIHMLKDIVQADIRARKLEFFVDSADVCDEEIFCDKLRLNQVLLNVLSNAIKYTPVGGLVSMRILQLGVDENGLGHYQFRVKDSGIGMNKEFLKTIYDPFTRVNSSTVSGIQGTGLGMSITKNIVDMMGGKIEIQSEENVGTEVIIDFYFRLSQQHKEPQLIPEVNGMRCLVVDDDTNACRSVVKMLKDIGMRSEWSSSGREAVIRTEDSIQDSDRFGLFLIDWLMPDVNGIEVARRLRRMVGEDVPILILTAYDWSDLEEDARDAGVTGFVSKPVFLSDLSKVIARYCCKHDDEPEIFVPAVNFTGKKVLLVEDNELNSEISREILEDLGAVVTLAEDGSVAVKIMENAAVEDFDIILMDVQMPIMDGYEATKRIRALPNKMIANIPIIAMTANAFAEDCLAALEAGMNEHIAKPVNLEKLKSVLARFIR